MNSSKIRSSQRWLRWRASGAVRTPSQHPEYDNCLNAAAQYQMQGDLVMAGMMRVTAFNVTQGLMEMKRSHCPNLGPYSDDNPMYCIHCNKMGVDWVNDEECIPAC